GRGVERVRGRRDGSRAPGLDRVRVHAAFAFPSLRSASTRASTSRGLNGFASTSEMFVPARSSFDIACPRAVSISAGTWWVAGFARSFWQSSSPFMYGIWRSVITMSGGDLLAISYACSPSDAVTTSRPALRSLSATTCTMCCSSSTTRATFPFIAIVPSGVSGGRSRAGPARAVVGDREPEPAPEPDLARHADLSAVHRLDDALHKVESQPRALRDALRSE